MKRKICLSVSELDSAFAELEKSLSNYAEVTVVGLDKNLNLNEYDIFIGKKLSEYSLSTANHLKAIFAYKTGVDDFPLKTIKERDIILVNSHADAYLVAQYTFAMAISLACRIPEFDRNFRKGIWENDNSPYWNSIFDMKIGLLGYGRIGEEINSILSNNGIETYTVNRGKEYENINVVDSVDDLCRVCDMLILSLPKTTKTNHIIGEKQIEILKDKYIINVGRSNCIDYEKLYYALKNKWVAGAAIDTWDSKPLKGEVPFFPYKLPFHELDNIILSPHRAINAEYGHDRYVKDVENKVITYLEGGTLTDVIDLEKEY